MRIFLAGHRGMVGRAIMNSAGPNMTLITANRSELDLTNFDQVNRFLREQQVDCIILAAARVGGIAANSQYQFQFLLENLKIQNTVLENAALLSVPNFIFLGSSCVYPRDVPNPIKESFLLTGPLEVTNEGYALAKITGIKLLNAIQFEQKLNYFSLMPTNLYGPHDNFDKFSSHVPAGLMRRFHEAKIAGKKEIFVWGTGVPRREFMHVDDLAQACWKLLGQKLGGQLINIGTGQDITIANFASLMAEIIGYEGNVNFDSSKPDGVPQKLLDVSKAHSYGWRHEIDLEDGLKKTYEWFVDALRQGEVRGY